MALVKVTPKNPGVPVRKENGVPLDSQGEVLERTVWWIRRENDGDVTLEEVKAEAAADAGTEEAPAEPAIKAKK